jgi:hypothetical protein
VLPEEKRPFERPDRIKENNIQMGIKYRARNIWAGSTCKSAGFCEHNEEIRLHRMGSIV